MNAVRREDGAVAVVTAISLVAMVLAAALVIDLGMIRVDARRSQTAGDVAVTAAAAELKADDAFVEACQQAWAYFTASVSGSAAAPLADCSTQYGPAFGSCQDRAESSQPPTTSTAGAGPVQLQKDFGDYTLLMQMPVRHLNDGAAITVTDDIMGDQAYDTSFDGSLPCQRIGIRIRHNRDHVLAGVSGFLTGSSNVDAVARTTPTGDDPEYPTLIVLEQFDCPTLSTTGRGKVIIQNVYSGPDLEAAGIIKADSDATDGSCGGASGNSQVFNPGTAGNSLICAGVDARPPGTIATIIANVDCGMVLPNSIQAVSSSHLALAQFLAGGSDDEQLEYDPVGGDDRTTRKPVDYLFNCLDTMSGDYPTNATAPQYPEDSFEPVPECENANRTPHIDELIAATMTGSPPTGFTVYNTCGSTAPVNIQYVYVDCDKMPRADFTSDVVVLRGGSADKKAVDIGTGQSVSVTPHTAGSSIFVVREGNVDVSGTATVAFNDTAVYLHDGVVKVTGADSLTWTAPDEQGYFPVGHANEGTPDQCAPLAAANDTPHPSCFQHLALWSNSGDGHSLGGNGAFSVRGIFFTPNADFTLSGNGSSGDPPLLLENAQFFSRTISVAGGAGIIMKPDPNVFAPDPTFGVSLIR